MVYKKKYGTKYRASHQKEINEKNTTRRVWAKALGLCASCQKRPTVPNKTLCVRCAEIANESIKAHRRQLRADILTHYSKGSPHCECCGESTIEFLSIDHINGGGSQHSMEIGRGKIYGWLRKNNYPEGFRVLCHNCNAAFGHYGYCPHNVGIKNVKI